MKLWLRPLPFALLAGYALSRAGRTPIDDAAPNRSAALCKALPPLGVTCNPEDVTWVDGPAGLAGATVGHARALVRGREKERRVTAVGRIESAAEDENAHEQTFYRIGVP